MLQQVNHIILNDGINTHDKLTPGAQELSFLIVRIKELNIQIISASLSNVGFKNFAAFTSDRHIPERDMVGCGMFPVPTNWGVCEYFVSYGCLWDSNTRFREGHGNPLWCLCLENPWTEGLEATIHRVSN